MAKKTTKAASKSKTAKKSATKKASTKKTKTKKTFELDVNSDGKVDIEDVKIVMEEANKSKKVSKKEEISAESKGKFNRKIRKQGIKPSMVVSLAEEFLGKGCTIVWDKNKKTMFHVITKSGEKFPEKGDYVI